MARPSKYSPEVKAAFIKATLDARKAGRKFKDAFKAATAAGYKGTPGGLYQVLLAASGKKKKPASKPAPAVAKRGPGRPKGSGRRGRPKGSRNIVASSQLPSIEVAVQAEVSARVGKAIAAAIQALNALL